MPRPVPSVPWASSPHLPTSRVSVHGVTQPVPHSHLLAQQSCSPTKVGGPPIEMQPTRACLIHVLLHLFPLGWLLSMACLSSSHGHSLPGSRGYGRSRSAPMGTSVALAWPPVLLGHHSGELAEIVLPWPSHRPEPLAPAGTSISTHSGPRPGPGGGPLLSTGSQLSMSGPGRRPRAQEQLVPLLSLSPCGREPGPRSGHRHQLSPGESWMGQCPEPQRCPPCRC